MTRRDIREARVHVPRRVVARFSLAPSAPSLPPFSHRSLSRCELSAHIPGEENKLRGHVERGVYGVGQKNVAVYMSRCITSLVYELLPWILE